MREEQGRGGGRGRGVLGAALLAIGLTACEGLPLQLSSIFTLQTAQPEPEPESKASAEPVAPTETPQQAPAPETEAEPEIAALPPEPVIDDNPARVMGLGAGQLTELLGQPELTRREPPAEIWQYRGESCVFDVFLYEEAAGRRVTYLEARDASAQRVAARGCLNQLLRARLAKPLG